MKKKYIILIIITFMISACSSTDTGKVSVESKEKLKSMNKLAFFDATVFDKELSRSMKAQEGKIEVFPIVTFSPNDIPERLGK